MNEILCSCKSTYFVNKSDENYHCDGCGYPLRPNDWRRKYLRSEIHWPQVPYPVQEYEHLRRLSRVNFLVGIITSVILTVSTITDFFDIGSPVLHLMVLLVLLPVVAALTGSTVYVLKQQQTTY